MQNFPVVVNVCNNFFFIQKFDGFNNLAPWEGEELQCKKDRDARQKFL